MTQGLARCANSRFHSEYALDCGQRLLRLLAAPVHLPNVVLQLSW